MSDKKAIGTGLDNMAEILGSELHPLIERTHGLADLLSEEVPHGSLGRHLAAQVEINLREIGRIVQESLQGCREA